MTPLTNILTTTGFIGVGLIGLYWLSCLAISFITNIGRKPNRVIYTSYCDVPALECPQSHLATCPGCMIAQCGKECGGAVRYQTNRMTTKIAACLDCNNIFEIKVDISRAACPACNSKDLKEIGLVADNGLITFYWPDNDDSGDSDNVVVFS